MQKPNPPPPPTPQKRGPTRFCTPPYSHGNGDTLTTPCENTGGRYLTRRIDDRPEKTCLLLPHFPAYQGARQCNVGPSNNTGWRNSTNQNTYFEVSLYPPPPLLPKTQVINKSPAASVSQPPPSFPPRPFCSKTKRKKTRPTAKMLVQKLDCCLIVIYKNIALLSRSRTAVDWVSSGCCLIDETEKRTVDIMRNPRCLWLFIL